MIVLCLACDKMEFITIIFKLIDTLAAVVVVYVGQLNNYNHIYASISLTSPTNVSISFMVCNRHMGRHYLPFLPNYEYADYALSFAAWPVRALCSFSYEILIEIVMRVARTERQLSIHT